MSVSSGQSSGSSTSNSSSTPSILPFLQQIASFSQGLASQTYDWANSVWVKNSALTDQNIQQFLHVSAQSLDQAQNDTSRYNNLFQPMENQLIHDANTYASADRIKSNMGAAEATTGQAMDAGRQNAIRDLQAAGIDPSSGRYQELDAAERAQAAAAQAGAGQQSRLATEATGRALRSEAIQVGERYPGQITNELNTAMQGVSGAENAALSNTNTEAAALGTAANFIKFPPVSNTSQSQGQSRQQATNSSSSPAPNSNKQNQPKQQPGQQNGAGGSKGPGYPMGGGNGAQPGFVHMPGSNAFDPGTAPSFNGNYFDPYDPSTATSPFADNSATAMPGGGTPFGFDPFNSGPNSPFDSAPQSDLNGFQDPNGMGGGGTDMSSYGQDPFNTAGGQGGNYSQSQYDPTTGGSYDNSGVGNQAGGYSQGAGSSGDYSSGGYYAKGGAIQGALPSAASPSGGRQTDDIQAPIAGGGKAHLNADEFVIPKDVALWKGQEFFQKLIMQSRKARVTQSPAQPTQQPAQQSQGGAI